VGFFVRKVTTATGAIAVQIAHTKRGAQTIVKHVGSAHGEAELAVLVQIARDDLSAGQQAFDLDALTPTAPGAGRAVITASRSQVLWGVLSDAYARLGFDTVGDAVFKQLVLARLVEPTFKADTIRVLGDLGLPSLSLRTIWRTLARCVERDWRDLVSTAAYAHAAAGSGLSLVLYDVTTLYFEAENEDGLRKVGESQGTPGRSPDHRGPAGRPGRVPAGDPLRRGQQSRDEDPDPGPRASPAQRRSSRRGHPVHPTLQGLPHPHAAHGAAPHVLAYQSWSSVSRFQSEATPLTQTI
jgi:hypothetical protein